MDGSVWVWMMFSFSLVGYLILYLICNGHTKNSEKKYKFSKEGVCLRVL